MKGRAHLEWPTASVANAAALFTFAIGPTGKSFVSAKHAKSSSDFTVATLKRCSHVKALVKRGTLSSQYANPTK